MLKNPWVPEMVYPRVEVFVKITGIVKNPGVYRMQKGDRVGDLLEKAGGIQPGFEPADIDTDKELRDGDVIHMGER